MLLSAAWNIHAQHNYDDQNTLYSQDGNVGIGTGSPTTTLDVNGHLRVRGFSIRLDGADLSLGHRDGRDIGDRTGQRALVHYLNDELLLNYDGDFEGGVHIQGPKTMIDGNLGIGVSDPTKSLEVKGDVGIGNLDARQYLKISSSHWPELRFQTPTSDEQIRLGVAHEDNSFYGVNEGDFYVYSGTLNEMPLIARKGGDVILGLKIGNVGIGTDSPSEDLHIRRSRASLSVENTNPSDWSFIRIQGSGANFWDIAQYGDNDYLEFRPRGGSTSGRVVIKQSGNVGIGTTDPVYKLDVSGDIQANSGWVRVVGAGGLYFESYGGGFHMSDGSWIRTYGNKNFYHNTGIMRTDGELRVGPGGNRLRVASNGNVGIGTTDPGVYKLAVNGNVRAKKVVVESGWSDFVFEPGYELPTLSEVEAHIAAKGHLQDIPSAAEVAEHGISLGEMDAKLLQKIEELMLYTIAQQRTIEEQAIIVRQLKEENESIKALSERLQQIEQLLKTKDD